MLIRPVLRRPSLVRLVRSCGTAATSDYLLHRLEGIDLNDPAAIAGARVVSFRNLAESTKPEILNMTTLYSEYTTGPRLAGRAVDMLKNLEGEYVGGQIDLLEHSLQTATRAHRDGADEETVVCALMHDVGELLVPSNHGEVAASILRPYVSPENWWVLAHHEVFQLYYYGEHLGQDKDRREVYRSNTSFKACAEFCERWDQASFDPSYSSMELHEFVPMLERIFARPAFFFDASHPKAGTVTG